MSMARRFWSCIWERIINLDSTAYEKLSGAVSENLFDCWERKFS